MKCPKCKNIIPDDTVVCKICGMKIRVKCPECKTLNILGRAKCQKCGYELLKYCPVCNAANNPSDKLCRKCHTSLSTKKEIIVSAVKNDDILKKETYQLPKSTMNKLAKAITSAKNNTIENDTVVPQSETADIKEISDNSGNPVSENNQIFDENIESEAIQEISGTLNDISKTENTVIDEQPECNEIEETPSDEEISSEKQENEDVFSEFLSDINQENEKEEEFLADAESDAEEISSDDKEYDEEMFKDLNFENEIYFQSQRNAKDTLSDLLINSEKYVIGLSGEEGFGKTYVLREVFSEIQSPEQIWLWAECTPLTQISSMGMLQDTLINLFNASLLCSDTEVFKSDTKAFFSDEFPEFSSKDVDLLINFLYPHKKSYYEGINANRERTFELLEKLFEEIRKKGRIFFVIDDFELIDGSSYDFICRLISKGFFNNDFKLIITYRDNRQAEGFISSNLLPDNVFESVHLGQMSNDEVDMMFCSCLSDKEEIPDELITQIRENSEGKPAYVESVISYLFETKKLKVEDDEVLFDANVNDIVIPKTISELSSSKLNSLKEENYNAYKMLMIAALSGNKFSIDILNYAVNIDAELFEECAKILVYFGYFRKLNESTFAFKNTLLWRECYRFVKDDEQYKEFNECLCNAIEDEILTNNSMKALIAENLELHEKSIYFWTENIKLSAYIGDISVYIISQKQCLKYLEKCHFDNETKIKNNIYERIGKLLSETAPEQAIEFLSNAIITAEEEKNVIKIIDIAAYLGKSAKISGNNTGLIEVVDLVLKYIDSGENPLGYALIKQKKLEAICALGNTAELVNIIENDIVPPLKEYFNNNKNNFGFDDTLIYECWIESNLTLAKAYILQGSNKATPILDSLSDIVKINKFDNKNFEINIKLVQAMNCTISGNIKKSQELLRDISQLNYGTKMEDIIRSKWNFLNVLNRIFLHQYDKAKEELFDVVTFANNCNDEFTKNILKIFLGKIIKESGNITKALDIYNEQVAYFAKTKVAIGAMLGWYFIIEATLQTEGSEKALEIAQKAIDVAKNTKIDNFYFMILYNIEMAEIYTEKGDLEATKMYIEKALLLAKKYDLSYLKIKLYLMYGKYFEAKLLQTAKDKKSIIARISKNYEMALNIAQKLELDYLTKNVRSAISQFESFCKLNRLN